MQQNNYQGRLQRPLGTGFTSQSTAAEVINGYDLSGKVAIVTGGSTGIGLETVKVLAQAGATVIVPVRNMEKALKNLGGITNVELHSMDLMDTQSIDAFAERFLETGLPLHILINNAGIMWVPLRRDDRGIESQLATNYLAAFQLTARLWPALKNAGGARVVNVSSYGHQMSPFNFDDPNFIDRDYHTLVGYGQSKTACNLFAMELDKQAQSSNVRAYSLHPGSINGTELGREASMELFKQMGMLDSDGNILPEILSNLKTIPQGAATTIFCATSPLLQNIGGVYCEDGDIAELDLGQFGQQFSNPNSTRGVQLYSLDETNAARLWKWSEQVTGIKFRP
ncbi:MAG: SDR family NAD(P)-dependent oxidoreductase [Chitinophagaceae bacterium]|nr:SDR family NAD(P)-dependent oxidoreductase [Chitinophagaceae bacterium]